MSFQTQKRLVLDFYKALDVAAPSEVVSAVADYCTEDLLWRGFHPFNEIRGAQAMAERFWKPLKQSLTGMQRRLDIFFAGDNVYSDAGGVWVCSMGHLMGLFDAPWLGIRPTSKLTFLRYSAFHKIENGKITETAMYFDIPHLMVQAGQNPFPPETGAHLVQPGPMMHNGLLFGYHNPEEGQKTLDVIDQMARDLGQWDSGMPLEDELRRTWHEDMLWWGPTGIGATYTIPRYADQHSRPFRQSFSERSKTKHLCRIGEGHFGAFFGWPNFIATPTGGFMGMPATDKPGEFRVIDLYRREGDKLKENWIFIDLLHFRKTQGVDILERTTGIETTTGVTQ